MKLDDKTKSKVVYKIRSLAKITAEENNPGSAENLSFLFSFEKWLQCFRSALLCEVFSEALSTLLSLSYTHTHTDRMPAIPSYRSSKPN